MDVKINVAFYEGRCFFDDFTQRNDTDPKSGKAGVRAYRCQLIGWILEKLGFAKGIICFEKNKPKVVYVNTKSFLKWRERHSNDEYITFSGSAREEYSLRMKQRVLDFRGDFEGSIKYITKSYTTPSYQQVMARAEEEFKNDPNKKSILRSIEGKLKSTVAGDDYEGFYLMKKKPYICISGGEEYTDALASFFSQLPGIDCEALK